MKNFFLIGLVAILGFSVLGELARLPLGPGNGLLPNDVLAAILVAVWLIHKTLIERHWPKTTLWAPFLTFSAIALISLVNGSQDLTMNETLASGLYWIRFVEYFFLIFIALDVAESPRARGTLVRALIAAGTLLAIAGFFQLKFMPDFTDFQTLGWDPHRGRLLSTWFDPNFIGGLFAFLLCLLMGLWIDKKTNSKTKTTLLLAIGLLLIALLFTYSRSAYLALMAGIGILGLMRSRRLLVEAFITLLLLVSLSERAEERMANLVHTAESLVGIGAELPDATARLRLDSWRGAWIIIQDKPLLGIGFNTYAYAQNRYGFLDDLDQHSATGSDSTLLTLWATTGTVGLFAYLWILVTLLGIAFRNRADGLTLGFFAGMIGLLVHSVFVNSLLFTPLLIFVYLTAGLTLTSSHARRPGRAPRNVRH